MFPVVELVYRSDVGSQQLPAKKEFFIYKNIEIIFFVYSWTHCIAKKIIILVHSVYYWYSVYMIMVFRGILYTIWYSWTPFTVYTINILGHSVFYWYSWTPCILLVLLDTLYYIGIVGHPVFYQYSGTPCLLLVFLDTLYSIGIL